MKILYVRAEDFANEFVNALQHKTTDAFHNKFRNADVLLIDDIQFIAGKEATEEEFFTRYEGLTAALLNAPNIMGFCYTQLYDVEQEVNGLYTYAREKKFADYSRIIAANRKKAAIEE